MAMSYGAQVVLSNCSIKELKDSIKHECYLKADNRVFNTDPISLGKMNPKLADAAPEIKLTIIITGQKARELTKILAESGRELQVVDHGQGGGAINGITQFTSGP